MVACNRCTRLGLPCLSQTPRIAKSSAAVWIPKFSCVERSLSIILVSSGTKSPSAHGEDLMMPPPKQADCLSVKDYVCKAQVWASKHSVNQPLVYKCLKRPQEPALSSAAGPSSAARPSFIAGLKRPLEDSSEQSPKRPCPSGPQTLGLAVRPRDPTPIVLSPELQDTKMALNEPSNTPSGLPPSSPRTIPHTKILQARAARASSIHMLESTNPPANAG
ncbi:hypothetical protein PTTG_05081 [Puccinia triticina 1-1 BBBD Race 1]|uniref:Uncharacterized protein n=1 Tax=Puccinia triticina (isolate 1-1 / race 1 (BBBD)) TaxID=630390 RepID=A0A0C4EW91_PUCT1|nr:hypothetical protein PTTG_05081 [Puccinia triticina 1-1 BBBD Race 1]